MSIWASFFIIIPVVTFPLIVPGIGTSIIGILCIFHEVVVINFIGVAGIMDVYAQVVFCDDVIIDGVKVAGITNDYTIIMVSDGVIKNYVVPVRNIKNYARLIIRNDFVPRNNIVVTIISYDYIIVLVIVEDVR